MCTNEFTIEYMSAIHFFNYTIPFWGAVLGMSIVFIFRIKKSFSFNLILVFSGSFLLGITVFHLMPEVFSNPSFTAGPWIISGLLLQIILEYLSQGAEHGHAHSKENKNLPWPVLLSLCIHSFIEGLPLSNHCELVWGIFIHKIPIGMVVFFLVWETKASTIIKTFVLLLFAIITPIGSFLNDNISFLQTWKLNITALVVGMLLHIATTILFESNQGHAFNLRKLVTIVLAFSLSFIL